VTIVQTYVPAYRVEFFEQLRRILIDDAVELRLVTSRPSESQAGRGDSVDLDWADQVRGREIRLGGRNLLLATSARYWDNSDAVIAMQQGTSLDTNRALVSMKRRKIRVGVWGHVKPFTSPGNAVDLWVERHQLRRADHVFAYTDAGAAYAEAVGVDRRLITSVRNTIDTRELENARDSLTSHDVESFRQLHALPKNKTFAFIGGLDQAKRPAFVAEVLDRLWVEDRSIRLLVGGSGNQSSKLDRSVSRGQTIMLGRVASRDKALMTAVSSALVMPGRIGLVALDSLVLGKPVLTTDWPFHAPEAEYLQLGESKFASTDSPAAFTELVVSATNGTWASQHSIGNSWHYPTMDAMVENFSRGIHLMLRGQ
jgi:hypothetical protein